eukprot:scaffold180875_cov35-Prasinocladus_malaysianus.AAC.1
MHMNSNSNPVWENMMKKLQETEAQYLAPSASGRATNQPPETSASVLPPPQQHSSPEDNPISPIAFTPTTSTPPLASGS